MAARHKVHVVSRAGGLTARRGCVVLLAYVLTSLLAGIATAQSQSRDIQYRPCTKDDLIGAWELVKSDSPPADPTAKGQKWSAYQYFIFYDHGRLSHVTFKKPMSPRDKERARRFQPRSTYALDGQGGMIIQHPDGTGQLAVCGIVLEEREALGLRVFPGDVFLGYLAPGGAALARQLLLRKSD